MSWERLIDCLAVNGSFDFALCVCSGRATPDSLVRCDVLNLYNDYICQHLT